MKKIYLICYVDLSDNTKGVICASENEPRNMTQGAKDSIIEWLQSTETLTKEEILDIIGGLRQGISTTTADYEIFTEETFIY